MNTEYYHIYRDRLEERQLYQFLLQEATGKPSPSYFPDNSCVDLNVELIEIHNPGFPEGAL